MTEGATSVSRLDDTIHRKSSSPPDEAIELPALRNPADANAQDNPNNKVIPCIFIKSLYNDTIPFHSLTHSHSQLHRQIKIAHKKERVRRPISE